MSGKENGIPMPSVANLIQKKRFNNEKKLLDNSPLGYITAYPKEDNPLIWYILVVGQKGSHYEGGHFIGEIHHSPKYPAEPPDYIMRTPNGRYEVNKKICLSNSGYHKGEWSSTWNIHTILIAFYSIWLDDKEHGISHITRSKQERLKLASESIEYNHKNYEQIYSKFKFDTLSFDVEKDPRYLVKKENGSEQTKTTIENEAPKVQTDSNTVEQKVTEQVITEQKVIETTPTIQTVTVITQEPVETKISNVDTNDNIVDDDKKMDIKNTNDIATVQDVNLEINVIEKVGKKKINKNIIVEEEPKKNKQKLDFNEIYSDINKINKSIDEQQKTINELTSKMSLFK